MYVLTLSHMFLGYGQLVVLDESLSVKLVSSWYQWICTVCIVLSENKYDTIWLNAIKRNFAGRVGFGQNKTGHGPANKFWATATFLPTELAREVV